MTNKERVKQYFEQNSTDNGVNAEQVAEALEMKRNATSAILNELERENYLIKMKTKPVVFKKKLQGDQPDNIFDEIAGSSEIMKQILNKCKIAVTYPGRGLPIMLLGQSGVGKSTLAEKIYLYAKKKKIIGKEAPFIVLNCADYANNKELLSSVLFGYKKGAFTGANKDTEGLFDKADQGYLFLDEVHRLSPEGQEKLFKYIDTGIITPIGNGAGNKKRNVRLIFATTEDVDNLMLDTFIRRIPIVVTLPAFNERNSEERRRIIHNLFRQECEILNCKFKISSRVLENLLHFKNKGNIGSLKNIVKIGCANSYYRKKEQDEQMEITIQDFNQEDIIYTKIRSVKNKEQWIYIDKYNWEPQKEKNDVISQMICVDQMMEISESFISNQISYHEFAKGNKKVIDTIMDHLIYQMEPLPMEAAFHEHIENILKFLQSKYGIEFQGIVVQILTRLLAVINMNNICIDKNKKQQLYEIWIQLKKKIFRAGNLAETFYKMADNLINEQDIDLLRVFMILFFQYQIKEERPYYYAIIIAHGYSTASSIASLVNQVYSEYIFDAFDMPYDVNIQEIVRMVRNYLKRIDTSSGVLIFVDTGSVLNITSQINDLVKGNLGIINNVTTQMALEAGNAILQKRDIESVLKTIVRYNSTTYHFIRQKEKQAVILVCCMKDLTVASKICDLLRNCLEDRKVLILEYDYEKLARIGTEDEALEQYDIQMIISTNEIESISKIPIVLLNELIEARGYKVLQSVLGKFYETDKVNEIIERIIKNFSLRNIMSQLTILNPEIIIDEVENVIRKMELELQVMFMPDLKQLLYMHIGVMVERLMQEKGEKSQNQMIEFYQKHKKFCEMSKKCFQTIEKRYHIKVNTREVRLIYQIITSKIDIKL